MPVPVPEGPFLYRWRHTTTPREQQQTTRSMMASFSVSQRVVTPAVGRGVVQGRSSSARTTIRVAAHSSSASSISRHDTTRVAASSASASSAVAASSVGVASPRLNMHQPTARQRQHRRGASVIVRSSDAAAAPTSSDGGDGKKMTTFIAGILWFFAHQLIGVGNDVIMKYTGSTLGVAQVVFLRFAFATLTMLPVMLSSGIDSFKTDRIPLHIARSVLLAAGIALYCQGLAIAPIAVVTTLNFTIPLFTLVMARIFLKERVDATRWIGTLVGFAGVMVVVQPGGAAFNPMWLVVLVSAAMFASLDVLNKVFVGKESFWAMIFYTAFFTTCISAIPAYMSWVAPTSTQLILLAVLGAGANLLLYCLLKSFSMVDASALAPFRYTELMWSAAVGAVLFAEIPAATTLIGAAVIIPSTLYVVWAENQKSKEEDAQ